VLSEVDASAGRRVADPHAPNSNDAVVRDAKVMEYRGFTVLNVDMDPSSLLPGDQAVHMVDVAVVDMNMLVDPFHTLHNDVDAEQLPLILACSVGVGDFQTVDFPVGHVLQEQAGDVLPAGVNPWPTPLSVGIDSDCSAFVASSGWREHPAELLALLEQNDISRQKCGRTESVESFLRVNAVLLGVAWETLHCKE
jgi:hypothetical protein